jgi:hypothetical protein
MSKVIHGKFTGMCSHFILGSDPAEKKIIWNILLINEKC